MRSAMSVVEWRGVNVPESRTIRGAGAHVRALPAACLHARQATAILGTVPDPNDQHLMRRAIELARASVRTGGGPFGCVIARDGHTIAEGHNRVTLANDPTAHAEVVAIRAACAKLGTFQL